MVASADFLWAAALGESEVAAWTLQAETTSETRQMYINGGWSAASEGATFNDSNPANGEVWATVAGGLLLGRAGANCQV